MSSKEIAISFEVGGEEIIGIVHKTAEPASRGLLVIVGGSQYRVGAHRQFVLMARCLAAAGVPVMRFDLRGMGDSTGNRAPLLEYDQEVSTAIDNFQKCCPAIKQVVLWGLCDGASAIALHAWKEDRVCGSVMLNPWVHTGYSWAVTSLKHYLKRLVDSDFWRRVLSGKINWGAALTGLVSSIRKLVHGTEPQPVVDEAVSICPHVPDRLPERMMAALMGTTRFIHQWGTRQRHCI